MSFHIKINPFNYIYYVLTPLTFYFGKGNTRKETLTKIRLKIKNTLQVFSYYLKDLFIRFIFL